jgi:hypothetical protein
MLTVYAAAGDAANMEQRLGSGTDGSGYRCRVVSWALMLGTCNKLAVGVAVVVMLLLESKECWCKVKRGQDSMTA